MQPLMGLSLSSYVSVGWLQLHIRLDACGFEHMQHGKDWVCLVWSVGRLDALDDPRRYDPYS